MQITYTKHAEEKLKRKEFDKFKVNKSIIRKVLENPDIVTKTKYGDLAVISRLSSEHILRVICAILNNNYKVITFHIARKGRYEN